MFDHNCTHVVCYRVIVAPYVRSLGHVFAYLYTLDDDLEHPMDYETSLLSKVFPLLQIALLTYIFKKKSTLYFLFDKLRYKNISEEMCVCYLKKVILTMEKGTV